MSGIKSVHIHSLYIAWVGTDDCDRALVFLSSFDGGNSGTRILDHGSSFLVRLHTRSSEHLPVGPTWRSVKAINDRGVAVRTVHISDRLGGIRSREVAAS